MEWRLIYIRFRLVPCRAKGFLSNDYCWSNGLVINPNQWLLCIGAAHVWSVLGRQDVVVPVLGGGNIVRNGWCAGESNALYGQVSVYHYDIVRWSGRGIQRDDNNNILCIRLILCEMNVFTTRGAFPASTRSCRTLLLTSPPVVLHLRRRYVAFIASIRFLE